MMKKLLAAVSLCFALSASMGCLTPQDSTGVGNPGLTQTEQALYDDGEEGRKDSDVAASVVGIPLFRLIKPEFITTPDIAAGVAEGAPNAFTPSGCATAVRTTSTVTYTFNSCTGPFGLTALTGKLVAQFSPGGAPGSLSVAIKSVAPFSIERLRRNGFDPMRVDVVIDTAAMISFDGTTQRIDWNGRYTGTSELGTLVNEPSFVSTYDTATQCVTTAGNATTTVTGRPVITTTVTGYRRCGPKTACPLPGGKVTFTRGGLGLTIEFLGGTRVRVSPPARPAFETDKLLRCTG